VKARGVLASTRSGHWDLTVETYGDDEYYRERSRSSAATRNCKFNLFLGKTAKPIKNWNRFGKARSDRDFGPSARPKALPATPSTKAQGMSVDRAFIYIRIHYAR